MTGIAVREAVRADRAAISACLARAFESDPVSRFLFPRDRSRLRRLGSFYRFVLELLSQHGAIHTDVLVRGAAVWRAPSPPEIDSLQAVRDSARMVSKLRFATRRAFTLEQIVGPARPVVPHWYLALIGTEPSEQGRGVGSALLAPILARCDREQLPAYLESSKAENIPFYERHGFRVKEELHVPNGPRLWPMLRKPVAPAPGRAPLNPGGGSAETPGV